MLSCPDSQRGKKNVWNKHNYKTCKLDFREWGGLVKMISIEKERQWPLSLFGRWEGVATLPDLGRRKNEHIGSFCPVSSSMNWRAESRFNASFLSQWTKSLFVPQWNLSLKSDTTPCEIQPCRCAMGAPPSCAAFAQRARMGILYLARLKMTLAPLIPTGVTKWAKLPV